MLEMKVNHHLHLVLKKVSRPDHGPTTNPNVSIESVSDQNPYIYVDNEDVLSILSEKEEKSYEYSGEYRSDDLDMKATYAFSRIIGKKGVYQLLIVEDSVQSQISNFDYYLNLNEQITLDFDLLRSTFTKEIHFRDIFNMNLNDISIRYTNDQLVDVLMNFGTYLDASNFVYQPERQVYKTYNSRVGIDFEYDQPSIRVSKILNILSVGVLVLGGVISIELYRSWLSRIVEVETFDVKVFAIPFRFVWIRINRFKQTTFIKREKKAETKGEEHFGISQLIPFKFRNRDSPK